MSKLVDIEKVKAEIDTLQRCTMDEHMNFYNQEAEGEYNALCKIEEFLDTLLEETQEDLEKAAEKYGNEEFPKLCNGCKHIPIDAFKEGAKWQREQQEDCPKIKGWVARDKDRRIFLYSKKPLRLNYHWYSGSVVSELTNSCFPEVTWEDPTEVELLIKKV